MEHWVVRMQLEGIFQALEYISRISYKVYVGSRGGLAGRRGKGSSQRIVRPEMREASVRNSKAPRINDKGKGKEKEAVEEEMLQEDQE